MIIRSHHINQRKKKHILQWTLECRLYILISNRLELILNTTVNLTLEHIAFIIKARTGLFFFFVKYERFFQNNNFEGHYDT